jgi:RNA polymerase sigma-70 factor (ECF subfamily)
MTTPGARAPGNQDATPFSLLERLRANDGLAWQRVMQLYAPLVRFWCRRAALGAEDAEDVSQEVFAAAAAGFGGFRRDRPGDSFRGWLRGITRLQVGLHYRRRKHRPQAEGGSNAWQQLEAAVDPLPGPGEDETTEINQLYRRALEQVRAEFEPRTWQAFWRSAIDGHLPATLTEELGMSPAAIRQAKSRVLRRLQRELGEIID